LSLPRALKETIAGRIAGEIILSNEPSVTLRKWRDLFQTSQVRLAEKMKVSPSVISDYEAGRRKSPGTQFVRRFVEALIELDEENGSRLLRELSHMSGVPMSAIIDLREFPVPVLGDDIVKAVRGKTVACPELLSREIYGLTVIDSIDAILGMSGSDFMQIFGTTTERALIFTRVSRGRSPMVAIRVSPLKPKMVVMHGPMKVDKLGMRLAEVEQIPLVISRMNETRDLVTALRKLHESVSRQRRQG
jgi:putative transcriptional regulator